MTHFIGIDVGTSAVKVVLVDGEQTVLAEARGAAGHLAPAGRIGPSRIPMRGATPRPHCSTGSARDAAGGHVRRRRDRPLRPDARGGAARRGRPARCARPCCGTTAAQRPRRVALRRAIPICPLSSACCRCRASPAPSCSGWPRHEPDCCARLRTVLLPKDYVRLKLTGETRHRRVATPPAPGGSTRPRRAWSARGRWRPPACRSAQMPRIVEGLARRPACCGRNWPARWGLRPGVVVAGGAGDAAAGAIGIGAINDGDAFVSLGTSGQLFVTTDDLPARRPRPRSTPSATRCPAAGSRWARC